MAYVTSPMLSTAVTQADIGGLYDVSLSTMIQQEIQLRTPPVNRGVYEKPCHGATSAVLSFISAKKPVKQVSFNQPRAFQDTQFTHVYAKPEFWYMADPIDRMLDPIVLADPTVPIIQAYLEAYEEHRASSLVTAAFGPAMVGKGDLDGSATGATQIEAALAFPHATNTLGSFADPVSPNLKGLIRLAAKAKVKGLPLSTADRWHLFLTEDVWSEIVGENTTRSASYAEAVHSGARANRNAAELE